MTTHEKIESSVITNTGLSGASLAHQLNNECDAMACYALSNGLDVAPDTISQLKNLTDPSEHIADSDQTTRKMAAIHQALAKVVYPATPRAITLLHEERNKQPFMYFLGPVPLIRRLSGVAIFFLVALLITSLDKGVNVENINLGLLNSNSHILFMNQLFLLCCAGLGAAFAALFQANAYIAKATYDPRYDSSYWSRIILGVIAGIIIVELLPMSLFAEGAMKNFGKPALAMLGGFSANVVYRILWRLVESMETMVKGSGKQGQEQQQAMIQVKASEQRMELYADTASKLVGLLKDIDGEDSASISNKINELIKDLLPSETIKSGS